MPPAITTECCRSRQGALGLAEEGSRGWHIVEHQYEAQVLYATLNLCLIRPSLIANPQSCCQTVETDIMLEDPV